MYGTNWWSMLQYWLLTGPGQKPFAAASWPVAIAHPWHARGGTCIKIYQAVKRRCLLQHSWGFTASSWKATVKRNQTQLVRLVRKPVLPERWRQRKWVRVWVLHLTLQIPSWVFMWGLSYMSGRDKDFPNKLLHWYTRWFFSGIKSVMSVSGTEFSWVSAVSEFFLLQIVSHHMKKRLVARPSPIIAFDPLFDGTSYVHAQQIHSW